MSSSSSSSPISSPFSSLSFLFTPSLLLGLVTWSTAVTLVGRYSRGVLHEQYTVSSTLIVTECVKLAVSLCMMLRDEGVWGLLPRLWIVMLRSGSMSVPALVYLIQNSMGYLAMESLPASTYMMLLQLKLLTTAVFAVLILRKRIFSYQWRALLLLFVGIVLIQWPTTAPSAAPSATSAMATDSTDSIPSNEHSGRDMWAVFLAFCAGNVGLMAALTQSVLSGFAGVYTEWQLKGRTGYTLWEQNAQLSLYSILFGFLSLPLVNKSDLMRMRDRGFFADYSVWAVWCVILNSCGGLLVAAVLLYADTILKNFASTVAILSTSLLSALLFHDTSFTLNFTAGTVVLLSAIFIYNDDIEALADSIRAYKQSVAERKAAVVATAAMRSATDDNNVESERHDRKEEEEEKQSLDHMKGETADYADIEDEPLSALLPLKDQSGQLDDRKEGDERAALIVRVFDNDATP